MLKMQFVLLAPSAVVGPRKIMVLTTDLTVLMHPNNLKGNIRIRRHRLVMMMRDDRVLLVSGSRLLGFGVEG